MRPFASHFDRLIKKYSAHFVLITCGERNYDAGKYVPGAETRTKMRGAIIPLPQRKVYQPGGSFTEMDRQLVVKGPIASPLEGAKVEHGGRVYSVEAETDHTDYGDVAVYVLKWVSSFDKGGAAP